MSDNGNQMGGTRLRAKSVRRMIDLLRYLAGTKDGVSVMGVSRAVSIPQSTTSEMLDAFIDLGLLTRDSSSRCYQSTPLLAALGLSSQPGPVADGHLFQAMDLLAGKSGLTVGLFGMNGIKLQPYRLTERRRFRAGEPTPPEFCEAVSGAVRTSALLSQSAIGHVLLASLSEDRANRLLWRMRADSGPAQTLVHDDIIRAVKLAARRGFSTGASGFNDELNATAVLLPAGLGWQVMALAVIYPKSVSIDEAGLSQDLCRIGECVLENHSQDHVASFTNKKYRPVPVPTLA